MARLEKIGLLGGTFDPIHIGHIHLALSLQELHGLDEVWFIVSVQNPLKAKKQVNFEKRFEMVKLALKPINNFKALDLEAKRGPPSYTIDTVKELKKDFPDVKFYLLLGDDHLLHFNKWKNFEKLVELATPIFATRTNGNLVDLQFKPLITKIPMIDISSSTIRERLKNNLYCGHLLALPVLDYIKQNGLYCLPYE